MNKKELKWNELERDLYTIFGKRFFKKKKNKMSEEEYNNSLEELEDLGFEILNNSKDKNGKYGIRKISIDVQFYEDGGWCIDSNDLNGMNATLDSGDNLISILPILKNCRDLFLKSIKEIDKKKR